MKNRKHLSAIILALILLLCFSSCQTNEDSGKALGATKAEVKRFAAHIIDNEYADAVALYNSEISGNSELEAEAANCIKSYLSDIKCGIFSGEYDNTSAEIKENTVKKVCSTTNCKPDNYDDLIGEIDDAFKSKVAYKSGIALFESENYADAIVELSKVLPEDSDYKDATEKRTTAAENYKNKVMSDAKDSISENDYIKAIDVLQKCVAILPNDVDLAAEIKTCEKNYISWIISEAESAFSDYTKFEDALTIIKTAFQQFPDNEELKNKYDYYLTFEPVSLFDYKAFTVEGGGVLTLENVKDNMQNTYLKAFRTGDYGGTFDLRTSTFDIGKKYNLLKGTIAIENSYNSYSGYVSISIYGDGKLLWSKNDITNSMKPFDIEVDITGVTDLKIAADGDSWNTGLLANATLQKTVK